MDIKEVERADMDAGWLPLAKHLILKVLDTRLLNCVGALFFLLALGTFGWMDPNSKHVDSVKRK